jgi:hypothetical protein
MSPAPLGTTSSDEYNSLVLEASGIGKDVQALLIRFHHPPLSDATGLTTNTWALVKEFIAETDMQRSVMVRAGDDKTADSSEQYAPNTLAKLVDTSTGQDRVLIVNASELSAQRAIALAHYLMQQGIKRLQVRTYETECVPDTIPERGETVQMPDGFTGVCLTRAYNLKAGIEKLTLRLINLDHTLLD